MKTKSEIMQAISENKDIQKAIKKLSHYTDSEFYRDCERWIKAIKEKRLICAVKSVSRSGMSRVFYYFELSGNEHNRFSVMQFYAFLKTMGYTTSRSYDYAISVGGCGMDMNFNTNYNIIHRLTRLGFLSEQECSYLSQQTPHIV